MLAALLLGLTVVGPTQVSVEPLQARLLRSIQLGRLADVDPADALALANDSQASFADHVLARTALMAAGQDQGFPEWPVERLLDRCLNLLSRRTHAFQNPPGVPAGFGGRELVFTVVYALVTSGQSTKAIDVLESHLHGGSRYQTAVVLQALRNIGDARSTRLIQKLAEAGDDANLAENLLADQHYPFLEELRQRLHLVPSERRKRADLNTLAAAGCGETPAVATYFLGFLPPAATLEAEREELALLRELTQLPCFHTSYFATRSLALRSAETIPFWTGRFRAAKDAWQRAQLARIGFARFEKDFADTALELLRDEPSQYVQWELMHGNIEQREGARFRGYWDLWLPPALQFHLNFPDGGGDMQTPELNALLGWLESGARPQDPWVRNHLLYGLGHHASGPGLRRYLRQFDALPEKSRHFWILWTLPDPRALPILRYWRSLGSPEAEQLKSLDGLIARLEGQRSGGAGAAVGTCCEPSQECLRSWLAVSGADGAAEITDAEQAQAWLRGDVTPSDEHRIEFVDSLERMADVQRAGAEAAERWEHIFGCWRRTDQSEAPVRISR